MTVEMMYGIPLPQIGHSPYEKLSVDDRSRIKSAYSLYKRQIISRDTYLEIVMREELDDATGTR